MAADGSSPAPGVPAPGTPKYRILMTADTVGGVWQYALELSRALIARGHSIALATMGGLPNREQRAEVAAIRDLELFASSYKLLWMSEPWQDVVAAADWLMGVSIRVRPDIVHLNDLAHGDLPWCAPVLTVGHSCVCSWWQAVHGTPPPPSWLRYRRRVKASLRASRLVVAPTHAMLRALEFHHGPLNAVRVIANGTSREVGGAGIKAPIVFSAGRLWDEGKNVAALATAARGLDWRVCVAGPDRAPDGERVAFENVCMLGALGSAHVLRWFARAAIYALPARYEPFGLSILEAARARCALVLGDLPSLREIWDGAALFVDADDREQLAHALRRLIDNAPLRERYAARARQRAQCYTPVAMAGAYSQAYADLDVQRHGFDHGRYGAGGMK